MNIQTVRDNLRNTIAGKEKMLADLYPNNYRAGNYLDEAELAVRMTTINFLQVNIRELKRILQDVEQCIPYREADDGVYGPEYQGQ